MSDYTSPFSCRGVYFLTKAGQFKQRYRLQEKLQLLGMRSDQLDAFIELFCPGTPTFVITQERADDWTTPHGRLTREHVLTHLLGNSLPNYIPKWVGPRSCGWTQVVGVDVDLHPGEEHDFRQRLKKVRRAFKILGVPDEGILISETPSGGKHYRFVLTRPVKTDYIEAMLAKVGIVHRRGKFEVFPSVTCGYRLPFGLVPGKEHHLTRAGEFIARFQGGEVPQVDWIVANRRAESHERRSPVRAVARCQRTKDSAGPRRFAKYPPAKANAVGGDSHNPLTKAPQPGTADHNSPMPKTRQRESIELLWANGIRGVGTRTEDTINLAWHLRFVQGLSADESATVLVEWVYRTGRSKSVTVMEDIRRGTRNAEKQTLDIVRWMEERPCSRDTSRINRHRISKNEVEAILKHLKYGPKADQQELLEFCLQFLSYSKGVGEADGAGWTAEIAAAEVMRRWHRCSGRWYKVKRDKMEAIGLIRVARGAWKRAKGKGRATTYHIAVPPRLSIGAELTLAEAMAYGETLIDRVEVGASPVPSGGAKNDSKEKIVKNNLTSEGISGERKQSMDSLTGRTSQRTHLAGFDVKSVTEPPVISMAARLRQEFELKRRELLVFPRESERRADRFKSLEPPPLAAVNSPLLDLPLDNECRDWLLRNSGPGMGIPKRYRLMIEEAQRDAASIGRSVHTHAPAPDPAPWSTQRTDLPICRGVPTDERPVRDIAPGFS